MLQLILFLCVLLNVNSCGDNSSTTTEPPTSITLSGEYTFPYQLKEPDTTFLLKKELQEISGICFSPDYKLLVAIQDEKGKLYFLDKANGAILVDKKFHKDGDYEDIAFVNNDIYVVKSTGTMYHLNKTAADTFAITKIKSGLAKVNDVEGLCHDKLNNRLLLACKGQAAKGDEFKFKKGVYAYDLATKKLSEKPVFIVSLDEIQHHLKTSETVKSLERFSDFFQPDQTSLTFSPSAIGIHPISLNIYILSSKGKVLIVLNPDGKIIHIEKMKKKIHKQPEGIAFDTDGTLYISNEGKDGVANIQRFKYK